MPHLPARLGPSDEYLEPAEKHCQNLLKLPRYPAQPPLGALPYPAGPEYVPNAWTWLGCCARAKTSDADPTRFQIHSRPSALHLGYFHQRAARYPSSYPPPRNVHIAPRWILPE